MYWPLSISPPSRRSVFRASDDMTEITITGGSHQSDPAMADTPHSPGAFPRRYPALADRLAVDDIVFLGLDFDGTLAPIVPSADAATIRPRSRRWLRMLAARPSVAVAVVSGRAVDDLADRVGVDGIVYAGNHGLEFRYGDRKVVHPGAKASHETIQTVADRLASRATDIPGCQIENKSLTLTVHYRETPQSRRDDVSAMVENTVSAVESDLQITAGKRIREVRPPVDWDKGAAVSGLRAAVPDGTTVYVGDDVTDEDVFEILGPDDVGIRVGSTQSTAATNHIDDTTSVATLLGWLAGDGRPVTSDGD